MSHAYADLDGMIPYKTHRYKVHTRRMPDQVVIYEVEWQRDWQTINQYPDHRAPNSWESTKFQFSSEDNAGAFARLVLDGELDAGGIKLVKQNDGARFVADGNARRTQHHSK